MASALLINDTNSAVVYSYLQSDGSILSGGQIASKGTAVASLPADSGNTILFGGNQLSGLDAAPVQVTGIHSGATVRLAIAVS